MRHLRDEPTFKAAHVDACVRASARGGAFAGFSMSGIPKRNSSHEYAPLSSKTLTRSAVSPFNSSGGTSTTASVCQRSNFLPVRDEVNYSDIVGVVACLPSAGQRECERRAEQSDAGQRSVQ